MCDRFAVRALVAAAMMAGGIVPNAGCELRPRRTPDDTLVVLMEGKIRSIDPRFTLTSHEVRLSRLVIPGLMTIEQPALEPRPALAESLEQTGELTWDATLRPGLRFSDGTRVTSRDVVYTFMSTLDPAVGSMHRRGFGDRIERVEAVDEERARFYLTKPIATLFSDLDYGIISARADRERGEIIGAGAYRVVEFDSEHRVLLERNPHHDGEPAVMPRIEARTVADANARAIMLVGGAADMTQNGIRPDLLEAIGQRARVRVDSGPGVVLSYLMMHNEDPVLSDVRVRRAIAHAIDRERIIAAKFAGRAALATGMVPPLHWAYEGDVPRYGYDPDRARELLDRAGYRDPDGPGGQPRLRLTYKTSTHQFRLAIARVIAAQLGEIGIAVEVRSFEFGTFFTDIKKGNYQLASMDSAPITEADYLYTYFHSVRIPSEEHPHTHNRWRYRNARIDELVALGRTTFDRRQRMAAYAEVQAILARDLPIIPLWHADNVAVMNIDVTDYEVLASARFGGLKGTRKRARGL
ncbi:MAG: ABC transporter substrate-binding protein [Proteobacteria bacterium]|nr:ABC transporter substrate-binding protein [Pseudomonadota bacterium]